MDPPFEWNGENILKGGSCKASTLPQQILHGQSDAAPKWFLLYNDVSFSSHVRESKNLSAREWTKSNFHLIIGDEAKLQLYEKPSVMFADCLTTGAQNEGLNAWTLSKQLWKIMAIFFIDQNIFYSGGSQKWVPVKNRFCSLFFNEVAWFVSHHHRFHFTCFA